MGLDVYLYKCADIAAHQAWERRREAKSETIKIVKDDYEPYRKAMAKWDAENPDPSPEVEVSADSKVHPDHLFKVGYLRSSYNGGGIERVLSTATGKGLAFIFEATDEYILRPDWGACMKRAVEARDAFDLHVKEHGSYGIMTASRNMFSPEGGPASDEESMAAFRAERSRWNDQAERMKSFGSSYGNATGEFFMGEPLKVVALIPGTESILGKRPVVYAVFEKDLSWYQHALQIVVEMIEHVVAQPDAQLHYLHWSG